MTRDANRDHILVRGFLDGSGEPVPVTSSPMVADLGGVLLEAEDDGRVVLRFEPGERTLQGAGVVQGGILAAMLDAATAFAVFAAIPETDDATTVSLHVDFLRPGLPGRYLVQGRLKRIGRRMAFAEAELVPEGGSEAVASASAVLAITREVRS